jgi:hypothetical protein
MFDGRRGGQSLPQKNPNPALLAPDGNVGVAEIEAYLTW